MPGVVIILGSQLSLFIFWILDPTDDSYVNWKTELKKLSMIHQRQTERSHGHKGRCLVDSVLVDQRNTRRGDS